MYAMSRPFRRFSSLSLANNSFAALRASGKLFVDKTGAIADLLAAKDRSCVFFARPHAFGKSLTLSTAAEMLAAGPLPPGVAPWPGYAPADARALFGGLAVHERLLRGDPSLGGLLQRPHFVVQLGLGGATSGAKLEAAMFDEIAAVAGKAFGAALTAEVRRQGTPLGALGALVGAVPAAVPVALLVDDYDAAISQDVAEGDWAAARAGIRALRSLAMAPKSQMGPRIERCLITGAARFPRALLFSEGAHNFEDLTGDPLLSRVLGFSEAEVCAAFPEALARLAGGLGTDAPGALAQLAHWHGGHCFDGATVGLNPSPVLSALRAGAITQRDMEGAAGGGLLGLAPGDLLHSLVAELRLAALPVVEGSAAGSDVADLQGRRVWALPLLLQAGLLAVEPGQPQRFHPPNECARASLVALLASALSVRGGERQCAIELLALHAALKQRSPAAFAEMAADFLESIPRSMLRGPSAAIEGVRESGYFTALVGALVVCAPPGVRVGLGAEACMGIISTSVHFEGGVAAWLVEVDAGRDEIDRTMALGALMSTYNLHKVSETELLFCSMEVQSARRKVVFKWAKGSRTSKEGSTSMRLSSFVPGEEEVGEEK